jgi:hypothetical protein
MHLDGGCNGAGTLTDSHDVGYFNARGFCSNGKSNH